jgi:hypothetical protein
VPPPDLPSIPERVRDACARVADRARSVRIDEDSLEAYAQGLFDPVRLDDPYPDSHLAGGDRESRAAFFLCLGAINFGSGWWPTIRKRRGRSGYFTVAAGLAERFRGRGAWSAEELASISKSEVAQTLGQDADHPLMAEFADSLRDVGARVLAEHGGRFSAVADAAEDSAVRLAGILAGWPCFADTSSYAGAAVPFFKRAQLVPTDLARAGVMDAEDEDRLTAFADNLVPHVLRVDGVLRLDAELAARIDAEDLLVHGSAEEVELRACAVRAVELLSAATGGRLWPARVDSILWTRGGAPRYKDVPRPRCRNTAY